jgi:hypothetical protein
MHSRPLLLRTAAKSRAASARVGSTVTAELTSMCEAPETPSNVSEAA